MFSILIKSDLDLIILAWIVAFLSRYCLLVAISEVSQLILSNCFFIAHELANQSLVYFILLGSCVWQSCQIPFFLRLTLIVLFLYLYLIFTP